MSEATTPAVAAGNPVSTTRIVGGVAVAYAASVIVQNAAFGSGAPLYSDPLGVVLAYYAENKVAVAVGLEAVNLPLLLLFVTFLMASAIVGYSAGLSSHRASFVTYVLVALITVLVFVILDLDRPRRGFIRVSQHSLLELQAAVHQNEPPASGAVSPGR